jgi:hypothetical protein
MHLEQLLDSRTLTKAYASQSYGGRYCGSISATSERYAEERRGLRTASFVVVENGELVEPLSARIEWQKTSKARGCGAKRIWWVQSFYSGRLWEIYMSVFQEMHARIRDGGPILRRSKLESRPSRPLINQYKLMNSHRMQI